MKAMVASWGGHRFGSDAVSLCGLKLIDDIFASANIYVYILYCLNIIYFNVTYLVLLSVVSRNIIGN